MPGIGASRWLPVFVALAASFLAAEAGASPALALLVAALLCLPLAALAFRARPAGPEADPAPPEPASLSEVAEALDLGLVVVDAGGEPRLANAPARRLLSLGEGSGEDDLAKALRSLSLPAQLLDAALTGEGASREWRPEAAGEAAERPRIGLQARPLAAGGALLIVRDLGEAQRLAARGRELVANVSHELKTPLTAIRGAAETLQDGALAEPRAARRFTGSILEQCQRLETLLGDLLTLSRLQEASAPSRHRPVELLPLARQALELLRPMAEAKAVQLHLHSEPDLVLSGDAGALERMLLNLLENAIKYNRPEGEVHLSLASRPGRIRIEVRDTGIGIPRSALDRIFERFFRVDKGRSRGQGGTGLGLAIVKHVVLSHGGTIQVRSDLGRGSTFEIHLPRDAPREGATEVPGTL